MRHHAGLAIPGAKASHVAEALAFGLGRRTNAALRAWLASRPLDRPALSGFDAAAAADRLSGLGGYGPASAFEDAARLSLAAVTDRHGAAASFAAAASAMDGRMSSRDEGVVGFVGNGGGSHLRLAAGFQAMRDHDRGMADFLTEFLLAAEEESPFDRESRRRLAWGDCIYRGFRPRIGALVGSMEMAWPEWLDFGSIEAKPQLVRRHGRPVLLVEGRSDSDGEVGLADTGRSAPDADGLIGACCLARLRSGTPAGKVSDFARRAMAAGDDLVEACLAEVPYGGSGGTQEARDRLARAMAAAGGR